MKRLDSVVQSFAHRSVVVVVGWGGGGGAYSNEIDVEFSGAPAICHGQHTTIEITLTIIYDHVMSKRI